MASLAQTFKGLGPRQLVIIGVPIAILLTASIFIAARFSTPNLAPLYGELEQQDSAAIISRLEQMNIPYEIGRNGSQILAPEDQVARLRLTMAEQGLPAGGTVGYELFDKGESLGSTNFLQNINLVRALEGELERSIATLPRVRNARVHLVMPRRELFSREQLNPSASIALKTSGKIERQQVVAIQHLVASAVPNLKPSRISVIDDRGQLLARGFDENDAAGLMASNAEEMRISAQDRLRTKIEQILEPTVGFGKVRAEVFVDMDFDRVTSVKERYDPEEQVVRSTRTVEETESSKEADSDTVSVGNNLPDADLNFSGGGSSDTNSRARTEETTNFEISKTITNQVRETGVVNRVSVAVLVDGLYTPPAEGAEGQIPVYQPRTEEELQNLTRLVQSTIGFDANRGDTVEVINLKFIDPTAGIDEDAGLTIVGVNITERVYDIFELVLLAIVGIIVLLIIVKPLMEYIREQASATAQEGRRLIADQTSASPALTGPTAARVPGMRPPEDMDQIEELIDIDRVEGRVKASSVKKVCEIVDKHPEEALSIIRTWLYAET